MRTMLVDDELLKMRDDLTWEGPTILVPHLDYLSQLLRRECGVADGFPRAYVFHQMAEVLGGIVLEDVVESSVPEDRIDY